MQHRPRKRFGQHFLHDKRVVQRIVDAVDPRPGETLVEIGPGLGALTGALLERAGRLHVVEVDRDLAARLEATAGGDGALTVHCADALRFDFCALADGGRTLRIVGNLPYNISTPLMFRLLDQQRCIRDMCFMLQKEVVDRLHAAPDTRAYGRLSVMVQWRCRVERLFTVASGAFSPPPKVDSAVVRLVPHTQPEADVGDPAVFARVVRAAFAHRRKTLRNNLRGLLDDAGLAGAGVDPGARAETLAVEDFARLSRRVSAAAPGA
jgi:16S rRNA (adenine1518-N6/adenine1519-N6)-dimethyltransferase